MPKAKKDYHLALRQASETNPSISSYDFNTRAKYPHELTDPSENESRDPEIYTASVKTRCEVGGETWRTLQSNDRGSSPFGREPVPSLVSASLQLAAATNTKRGRSNQGGEGRSRQRVVLQ